MSPRCRDKKRGGWELPKGGAELAQPRPSTGCTDSSPFATGRGELWEEAGVWLAWREPGSYMWVSPTGSTLTSTPAKRQSAFLCTDLRATDEMVPHDRRAWMTLEEFAAKSMRQDHVDLLQRLQASRRRRPVSHIIDEASEQPKTRRKQFSLRHSAFQAPCL